MATAARHNSRLPLFHRLLTGVFAGALVFGAAAPAFALSELKTLPGQTTQQPTTDTKTTPAVDTVPADDTNSGASGLPRPDPLINKQVEDDQPAQAEQPDDGKPVDVIYDINTAPEPVRRMREMIVEAAASGDIERLRSIMNPGPNQTQVTIGETADDPIKALKELSGDPDGLEILAILLDIISTGFVHTGVGTDEEMYVWPYFTEKSLASLTPPEKVELLRIVTAGDFSDMLEFGGYNFYRIGITPTGQWKFFVAGD